MTNKIMEFESVLPEDFDGTFRFTNWTDEDFAGQWGGKQYIFPAQTTSPMIILNQTPLEIQQIRKHFAKKLAEREFFKGNTYQNLLKQEKNSDGSPRANSLHMAGTYSMDDLTPLIQKCLEPLPVAKAKVQDAPRQPLEEKLSRDEDGELNTIAVKQNSDLVAERKSLKKKALDL